MTLAPFPVPPIVKRVTVRAAPARAFALFAGDFARWWPLSRVHTGPDPVDCAYLRCSGVEITPDHEATSTYMAISLVVSTRGIALLPLYTQNFLPPSVTSRPIKGEAPTIDLVLGYHKENKSPLLELFLSRVDDLVDRGSKKSH